MAEAPALTDVTGVAIGSRLPETGSLQTSDEDLNQLISNIEWTAQNACLSVPMDCPQRAERLGWTGDTGVNLPYNVWKHYGDTDIIVDSIIDHQYHLTTGYLGSQWLLHVLADNGHTDIAYKVLQQKTYPSWLYMVRMNQTTMWESWGSLNPDGTFAVKRKSLNHEALGSVGDWMFQSIGGLVPDADSPAFRHFTVRPRPGGTLRHAEVTYQSPQGIIVSRWTLKENQFSLDVEVPVNSNATIVLPTANVASITESGLPAALSPGVVYAGVNHGSASYDVGSGRYSFAAMLTNSLIGNRPE
jgi:hypothetical protein